MRTIGPLQSLPLTMAVYMFFAMLVAFAFRSAIHLRFQMPSGEPCLCGYHPETRQPSRALE